MKQASSRELFGYWTARRGTRRAPERGEIEPSAIRRALGDVFILEFDRSAGHPFRHCSEQGPLDRFVGEIGKRSRGLLEAQFTGKIAKGDAQGQTQTLAPKLRLHAIAPKVPRGGDCSKAASGFEGCQDRRKRSSGFAEERREQADAPQCVRPSFHGGRCSPCGSSFTVGRFQRKPPRFR